MKASRLRHFMNLWPPFLFSGIHVARISDDFRHVRVELRQRWYNRNYVGTHFAMTDPFWMIMVLRRLGRDYLVWDQAADIRFVKPGRGRVSVEFDLDEAVLDEIRAAASGGEKVLRWFEMDVRDEAGDVVARVRKQVYVRRKRTAAGGGDAET
jgi:acyl-coenzyme A thioesterase PaaI-like protein